MSKLFHKFVLGGLVVILLLVAFNLCSEKSFVTSFASDLSSKSISLDTLWKKPVQPVSSIAISPDGTSIVTVGPEDIVTARDVTGKVLWQVEIPNVTHAIPAFGGAMTMVYSFMNPTEEQVTFISSNGSIRWRQKISGSIWCAAVADKEPLFAIGTGERWVYIYSVDDDRRRYTRWRLPGVVTSLDFLPDGEHLAYGTWQESCFGLSQIDGSKGWRRTGEQDKLYNVIVGDRGKLMLTLGVPNRRLPNSSVSLYSVGKSLLWNRPVDALDLEADISNFGHTTAISYQKPIAQKEKDVVGRYVASINRQGTESWEKGGMFFQPQLISFTRDGLLVRDERSIYGLDMSGKVSSMIKLPALVRTYTVDKEGRKIVVYCGDGNLYCINVQTK